MAQVNPLSREIHLKIVYYGPGLGGKTTTLQYIHDTADSGHRGKMVSLATPVERTLYFDYLPVRLPEIGGYALKLQLFTVPGQIHFNATRKLVLSNCDGVVFVADSQRSRLEANLESFDNLLFNLSDYKVDVETFPIIFHYNKRDLTDILTIEELEKELNRRGRASFGTCAVRGTNVYEGLECITKEVIRALKKKGETAGAAASKPAQKNTALQVGQAAQAEPGVSRRERLPLEDAVSKIADFSVSPAAVPVLTPSPEVEASEREVPPPMERPTIPAPFALTERAVSDPARARIDQSLQLRRAAQTVPRFTMVPLWPEAAKKRGMEIETAICERRYLDAARLISAELELIFTIHRRGKEGCSTETLVAFLGLEAGRYHAVTALAAAKASDIVLADVLGAYLFLLQAIDKSR